MLKKVKHCRIHGSELSRQKVPISYGLPIYDPAWDVEDELFPNSFTRVLGGCCIADDSPSESFQLVCSECREAEDNWRRENGAERPM